VPSLPTPLRLLLAAQPERVTLVPIQCFVPLPVADDRAAMGGVEGIPCDGAAGPAYEDMAGTPTLTVPTQA
jgi:hypothetical protein